MASLKDKMYELTRFVRNTLADAVGYADQTGKYQDFEKAMKEVHATERRLKSVRAHVRMNMRKTLKAFQDACPHTTKVDTQVRQSYTENDGIDGRRIVEVQTCSNCSKSFDLREKVQ